MFADKFEKVLMLFANFLMVGLDFDFERVVFILFKVKVKQQKLLLLEQRVIFMHKNLVLEIEETFCTWLFV